jgi:hypothetical protein
MDLSSPRFKASIVSLGFSFWFFVIINAMGQFSIELMILFVGTIITITQIFAIKLSIVLDLFAIVNTKIFLGILFIFLIALYGILFKVLRIDLLRLKKQNDTYWIKTEHLKPHRIFKQF